MSSIGITEVNHFTNNRLKAMPIHKVVLRMCSVAALLYSIQLFTFAGGSVDYSSCECTVQWHTSIQTMSTMIYTSFMAQQTEIHEKRRYRELFPNSQLSNHHKFAAVDRRMREYGIRDISRSGRPQLHWVAVEDNILQLVDDDPTISTQRISAAAGISQTSVWHLIRREQLQPFHLQKVQDLLFADYPIRQQFCHWLLQQHTIDPMFSLQVLFTDEALFTRGDIINAHNMHMWAYEYPHTTTLWE